MLQSIVFLSLTFLFSDILESIVFLRDLVLTSWKDGFTTNALKHALKHAFKLVLFEQKWFSVVVLTAAVEVPDDVFVFWRLSQFSFKLYHSKIVILTLFLLTFSPVTLFYSDVVPSDVCPVPNSPSIYCTGIGNEMLCPGSYCFKAHHLKK